MNIEKEREAFEAWAFQNIENLIDAQRDGNYYVMKPNSRLTHRDKEFLILSLNRGWASWQASALHAAEKLEGCVVVPVEPTEEMYQAYAKHSVAPMSTLSKTGYKAMLEAARGGK